jgi:hypothetical protein
MNNIIVIRFLGICVHVQSKTFPALKPTKHRVILPAHLGGQLAGRDITTHIPMLLLQQPLAIDLPCVEADEPIAPIVYTLSGVSMRIANAAGPLVVEDNYKTAVHHLDPDGFFPPDDGVILHAQPPAAAYFDFDHGIVSACRVSQKGAVGTTFFVETEDVPQLELNCFDGATPPSIHELPSGTILTILNAAVGGADSDDDFLLSYTVCASIPRDVHAPPRNTWLPLCIDQTENLPIGHIDFSPGCSNSNYP